MRTWEDWGNFVLDQILSVWEGWIQMQLDMATNGSGGAGGGILDWLFGGGGGGGRAGGVGTPGAGGGFGGPPVAAEHNRLADTPGTIGGTFFANGAPPRGRARLGGQPGPAPDTPAPPPPSTPP